MSETVRLLLTAIVVAPVLALLGVVIVVAVKCGLIELATREATKRRIHEVRDFHLWPEADLDAFIERLLRRGLEEWSVKQRHRIMATLPAGQAQSLLRELELHMKDTEVDFPGMVRWITGGLVAGHNHQLARFLALDQAKVVSNQTLEDVFGGEAHRLDQLWAERVAAALTKMSTTNQKGLPV